MPTWLDEILTRTTLAKMMLREDTGLKMVVSDFDAFIHSCTIRGTQNFVNKIPCRHANRQGAAHAQDLGKSNQEQWLA